MLGRTIGTFLIYTFINKSGKERYSIPVFFSRYPDYIIECSPNCCEPGQKPKYPAISIVDAVGGTERVTVERRHINRRRRRSKRETDEVCSKDLSV